MDHVSIFLTVVSVEVLENYEVVHNSKYLIIQRVCNTGSPFQLNLRYTPWVFHEHLFETTCHPLLLRVFFLGRVYFTGK